MKALLGAAVLAVLSLHAQDYTRGIGVYPGSPKQDFSPRLKSEVQPAYRNLALRRAAFHSSSYDYNLTAQLVTDGIKDTRLPRWETIATSAPAELKKNERQWLFDDNPVTSIPLRGQSIWVQAGLLGGDAPFEVDHVEIDARSVDKPKTWTVTVSGSDDGQSWKQLGSSKNPPRPSEPMRASRAAVNFATPAHYRYYKFELAAANEINWAVADLAFYSKGHRLEVGGPRSFTSAWKSAGNAEEWVYVDLGAKCRFDRVTLSWIRRATRGAVQVSDDAETWKTVKDLTAGTTAVDDLKLATPAVGRYVRVLMTQPTGTDGYVLSELEVYGRGGFVVEPHAVAAARTDGRIDLAGGAWKLQRDSQVKGDATTISKAGYADADWLVATVPGTVLTSYLNAGALPNPDYSDNQNMISDSFFYSDFWYRNEFTSPVLTPGKHVWLNFAGINWKADVYLNGTKLGRIEGAFQRARYDITALLAVGKKNALAVHIERNATPGAVREKNWQSPDKNGGALGADNPTFHASIGWDWIPTVRGRNIGIWNEVFLVTTGAVTVDNPLVTTKLPLPDTSSADVTIETTVRNYSAKPVAGHLAGRFGELSFSVPVALNANESKLVKLDPSTVAALHLKNPKLWWPAGYGEPNLYPVELKFETGAQSVSDTWRAQIGVRQFTYSEDGGALRMWINGRRFVARGGNWGFVESNLRYRAREYDAAVRYHADQHFTMIRNWVGQIGEDAFYEACDRHGIVVWQDFWLANPWDGPDPDNNALFLANAQDTVLRIRNHASVGLYCGRNEGYPPPMLDAGLRQLTSELHPGLHFISSSADGVVGGRGPYQAMPIKYYFEHRAPKLLHSEMGMPNIMTEDSVKQTMRERDLWPQGDVWGVHDFSLGGAQGGASFLKRVEQSYGGANNAKDWIELAQFINYEGYRAMFEAQSKHRMGLLLWMSHPTWPSFVWQTYDYYLEPTAAYFGAKKGSEPLHIQWNPAGDKVEVVNYSAGNQTGLTAAVEVLNLDGSVKWSKTATLDSKEDSVEAPIQIEFPAGLSEVHFVRLKLTQGAKLISDNFYWRGAEEANFKALRTLAHAKLDATTKVERKGAAWRIVTELKNSSAVPALLVRAKVVRAKSGDRILPVLFDDNYVSLMPGETRVITAEVADADTRGEQPRVSIDGFNVADSATK